MDETGTFVQRLRHVGQVMPELPVAAAFALWLTIVCGIVAGIGIYMAVYGVPDTSRRIPLVVQAEPGITPGTDLVFVRGQERGRGSGIEKVEVLGPPDELGGAGSSGPKLRGPVSKPVYQQVADAGVVSRSGKGIVWAVTIPANLSPGIYTGSSWCSAKPGSSATAFNVVVPAVPGASV